MKEFYIIYTLNKNVRTENRKFESFQDAENWLEEIGAEYWEIGMSEEDFKEL